MTGFFHIFVLCFEKALIMKIVSYNVNGIRAAINKGLLQWINEYQPDVLCFQELKATPDQIPLTVPWNRSHLEGNSPTVSAVTSS